MKLYKLTTNLLCINLKPGLQDAVRKVNNTLDALSVLLQGKNDFLFPKASDLVRPTAFRNTIHVVPPLKGRTANTAE